MNDIFGTIDVSRYKIILYWSDEDQVFVAEKLITSLDEKVVPDNEALWIKEAERRFKEIQDGTAVCRPAEEVPRDARAKLATPK